MLFFLPDCRKIGDIPLDYSEKVKKNVPQSKYPQDKSLYNKLRQPVLRQKIKRRIQIMKTENIKSMLSFIVCMVLIAAMALFTIGCNDSSKTSEPSDNIITETDITELGDGETQISFTVVDLNGKESHFVIYTDRTILGDALMDHDLIAGEESEYGLYIKTVNGITLDYDKDGKYWAFYIDGKYATTGVDTTEIEDHVKYYLKAE